MKGSKREKGSKKNPIKKPSRKPNTRTYLGNYDSRKEKINQSLLSNRAKNKPEEDNGSQGMSDYVKSEKNKSGFFKKREKGKSKKKKSPLVYKEITELKSLGGFLSKTDDLRFLKKLAKEKVRGKERRGSSAYTKDKGRMVQSSHNSKHQKDEELLSSQNISELRDEDWEKDRKDISRSLIVNKRGDESDSRRDNKTDIEFIKQKYLGSKHVSGSI